MIVLLAGATDTSVDVQVVDDSGLPVTGLVAATFPTVKYSKGTGADSTITLSDLTALTDAHSDGGVKERGEGVYRLDLPDAVASAVAPKVTVRGEATDKRLICPAIQVASATRGLSGTALPAAAADAAGGLPISDAGGLDLDARLDAAVSSRAPASTALSTANWTTVRAGYLDNIDISDIVASQTSVDTLTTELAKVPKSDGTATWNATALASIQSEANDALVAYDPPTRAELTSDTNSVLAKLAGLVLESLTIGATGNSTTTLHLSALTYGDDEINNYLLVIYDNSEDEYHARWIEDWVNATKLATVATLPFTPENSVDTCYLLSMRSDVTGGSGLDAAGVRAAVGLASANLDTQLGTIDSNVDSILADTNELQTDLADGGRLDLIVDAILVDTAEIGAAGVGLTEAGGTGDHLTAVPWNAAWDAEVQSEVQDAIEANNLDHLLKIAVDTNFATTVHLDSVIGHLADNGTTATFDRTADSLEAVRDYAAPASTALSTIQWTNARAGYLDNIDVGGLVASSDEVTSIQNNTRCVRSVPTLIERPDSGTATYRIELFLYDEVGNMEAPTSDPTLALVDQGGTDLSGRLDSTTGSLVSTGRYRWIYTASDTDDLEQLNWTFSVVEGGQTRTYGNTSVIVDTTAVDFTSSDRTKLEGIFDKLPSKSYLTGTNNSDGDVELDEATGLAAANVTYWAGSAVSVSTTSNLPLVATAAWQAGGSEEAIALDAMNSRLLVTVDRFEDDTITTAAFADGALARSVFAADSGLQPIRAETAQSGSASTLQLDISASSVDDYYNDCDLYLTGGTGAGQVRSITDYVGGTQTATVKPNWATTPNSSTTFAILPRSSAWDQVLADHADSGSAGEALTAAGSAGDPWTTALPGSYTAGQAGYLLAAIHGFVDTEVAAILAAVDTEVAAIKAKTDNLPADPADASDIASSFSTVNATLATIAGYIDTEVAAIKAKTDNLPSDPADASDIAASFTTVNDTLSTIAGYIDTEVAAIKAVTDQLADTLEDDGGTYRFTTNALEQAPTGGSAPSAGEIADAVLDEAISGHATAGTLGKAIADVQAKTDQLAFTSGNVHADLKAIAADTDAATNAAAYYRGGFLQGTVSDLTTEDNEFSAAAGLSSSNDFYNGSVLVFVTGALKGIPRKISDYAGATRTFFFTGSPGDADEAFPAAPADGDEFVILGRMGS